MSYRYFIIVSALRGCYMPDSVHAVAVKSRREIKGILESEYDSWADSAEDENGRFPPARRRAIASVAAALWRRSWRDRDSYLSTVLPTAPGCGIQVNPISRAEYLAARGSDEC